MATIWKNWAIFILTCGHTGLVREVGHTGAEQRRSTEANRHFLAVIKTQHKIGKFCVKETLGKRQELKIHFLTQISLSKDSKLLNKIQVKLGKIRSKV